MIPKRFVRSPLLRLYDELEGQAKRKRANARSAKGKSTRAEAEECDHSSEHHVDESLWKRPDASCSVPFLFQG